ncbi:MAG: fumarylacetoacetase, partial [Rhodothermales bacterium]
MPDPTTDPSLQSFIEVAPNGHFPIQNLPFGVFRPGDGAPPRVGVAIGDFVLDLSVLEENELF